MMMEDEERGKGLQNEELGGIQDVDESGYG